MVKVRARKGTVVGGYVSCNYHKINPDAPTRSWKDVYTSTFDAVGGQVCEDLYKPDQFKELKKIQLGMGFAEDHYSTASGSSGFTIAGIPVTMGIQDDFDVPETSGKIVWYSLMQEQYNWLVQWDEEKSSGGYTTEFISEVDIDDVAECSLRHSYTTAFFPTQKEINVEACLQALRERLDPDEEDVKPEVCALKVGQPCPWYNKPAQTAEDLLAYGKEEMKEVRPVGVCCEEGLQCVQAQGKTYKVCTDTPRGNRNNA